MRETKLCSRCGIVKPLNEFGVDRKKSLGVSTYCRICNRDKQRERRLLENPDWVLRTYKEIKKEVIEEHVQLSKELLKILGYDVNGEKSVHQQFMERHFT